MKKGDKFESVYLKFILACIVSLVVGITVPYLVSVWLGISNTPIPSIYMDFADKVGFIAAFLGSLISTLVIGWWSKNSNEK